MRYDGVGNDTYIRRLDRRGGGNGLAWGFVDVDCVCLRRRWDCWSVGGARGSVRGKGCVGWGVGVGV